MSRAYDEQFAEHASLEAIEIELSKAARTEARWAARRRWLSELRAERARQITAGIWPTPKGADQ